MTWTERAVGIGLSILITAAVFAAAAYGSLTLIAHFRQATPHYTLAILHGTLSLLFALRTIRDYSTGSIGRGPHMAPVARRDRPAAFWLNLSLYALLAVVFGYLTVVEALRASAVLN